MEKQVKDSFQLFLNEFHKVIDGYPEIEKITSKINELKEKATLAELTYHQKDAILSRCKNYLKCQYGEQVKRVDNRSEYSKKLN